MCIRDSVNITTRKVVYANPFNNNIDIVNPTNAGALKSLQVFDILGQKVMEYNYPNIPFFLNNIKTNQLAAGIYILKLVYTNQTITRKTFKVNR